MKKYELTDDFITIFRRKLFRIKALVDFSNVKAGELGGYVEKENNLSNKGDAWVSGDALVYGNARVSGDAQVYGDAQVSGDALVSGDADYATIKGFGTRFRNTTFFKCENNTVKVSCGCFLGTINEFREQVKKTRTGKIAEEYLRIADLMEFHFNNN